MSAPSRRHQIASQATASLASGGCAPSEVEASAKLQPIYFKSAKQKKTAQILYVMDRDKARQT